MTISGLFPGCGQDDYLTRGPRAWLTAGGGLVAVRGASLHQVNRGRPARSRWAGRLPRSQQIAWPMRHAARTTRRLCAPCRDMRAAFTMRLGWGLRHSLDVPWPGCGSGSAPLSMSFRLRPGCAVAAGAGSWQTIGTLAATGPAKGGPGVWLRHSYAVCVCAIRHGCVHSARAAAARAATSAESCAAVRAWRRTLTRLPSAYPGTFGFFPDICCFQDLDAGQRLFQGQGVCELANPGATLLLLSFGPKLVAAAVGGASQEEKEVDTPSRAGRCSRPSPRTPRPGLADEQDRPRWYKLRRWT